MARSIASLVITGNVGRDPEIHAFSRDNGGESRTAGFSVAVNFPKRVGDGWEQETDWYNVDMRLVRDQLPAGLKKGATVTVIGTLRQGRARDGGFARSEKTGAPILRLRAEESGVVVHDRPAREGDGTAAQPASRPAPSAYDPDADLPF